MERGIGTPRRLPRFRDSARRAALKELPPRCINLASVSSLSAAILSAARRGLMGDVLAYLCEGQLTRGWNTRLDGGRERL